MQVIVRKLHGRHNIKYFCHIILVSLQKCAIFYNWIKTKMYDQNIITNQSIQTHFLFFCIYVYAFVSNRKCISQRAG